MWLEQSRQRKGAGDRVTGKDVTLLGTLRTRAWTLRAPGSGGLSRQILRFDSGRSQSCWPGSGPVKWTAGGKQLQWEELGACCPRLWQTAGSPDGRMWMRREGSGTCELEDRSEVRGDGARTGRQRFPAAMRHKPKGSGQRHGGRPQEEFCWKPRRTWTQTSANTQTQIHGRLPAAPLGSVLPVTTAASCLGRR